MRQIPPFLPDSFEVYEGSRWILSEAAGLRMNEAFIAAPRPGEDWETWMADLRRYRERMRTGRGAQPFVARLEGPRGGIRLVFSVARALGLQPGETLRFRVEARCVQGSGKVRVEFDETDPVSEALRHRQPPSSGLVVPADGAWHTVRGKIVVPSRAAPPSVLRPALSIGEAPPGQQDRVDVRRLDLIPADRSRRPLRRSDARPRIFRGSARSLHDRTDLQWASRIFTCHFTFLYDSSIYRPETGWRVEEFLRDGERAFGGYDAVVLWQAYPRIGVDDRNQFDHYRDMPGGLEGLREVVGAFHAKGVRVFIDYNPWDRATRREGIPDEEALAELVAALDADGIFLDTMKAASPRLRAAVDAARPGVVFAPEGHPGVDQLSLCNASWAQWLEDADRPGALRLKWIEPRHMQHRIRRWDATRRGDIESSLFNGSGILIWENVFGTWNPWTPEDGLLWKRAVTILRAFADVFTGEGWEPLVPTLVPGLHAHRWKGEGCVLYTLQCAGPSLHETALLDLGELPPGAVAVDLWDARQARVEQRGGTARLVGDAGSLGCFFVGAAEDARVRKVLAALRSILAEAPDQGRRGARSTSAPREVRRTAEAATGNTPEGMVFVAGGKVRMRLTHTRRECGCHPDPGTPPEREKGFLWGSPHDGSVSHDYTVDLGPFHMDIAQVSNEEYRRFLDATGYQPRIPDNFLKHWVSGNMPEAIADLPVVYVDLDDARAYALWASKRLPTEPEWQLAAQGIDGRSWPWGDSFDPSCCAPGGRGPLPVRSLPEGRSPFGCLHMSGNVWEWTESERSDGHTRFVIIRGGSWFRPEGSMWYMPGGPQPCTSHAKLLLMAPGLDRSPTIGFRCVRDAED